jgi:hypothetical protein
MNASGFTVLKARPDDFLGRFREVVSDPLNLLIERVPMAGYVEGDQVYLHNGLRVPVVGPGAYYGPFCLSSIAACTSRSKNTSSRNC